MDYIDVAIAAFNTTPAAKLDPADRHVPGVYSVMVQKGLGPDSTASAAMDVFHSNCPVGQLDDFAYVVFDQVSGSILFEDPDHESYSKSHLGRELVRLSDVLPKLFAVKVMAVGEDRTSAEVGSVQLVATNKTDARNKAHALLWDDRLDAASCSPCYEVESRGVCELEPDEPAPAAARQSGPRP